MDEDATILTCVRTGGFALEGSVPMNCDDCGHEVMVSESGQEILRVHRDVVPVCVKCTMERIQKGDE